MPRRKRTQVTLLVFAAVGVIGLSSADQGAEELRLSADFGNEVGKIRPALHSSGFGLTICSQTEQDLADVKAMGFDYARTHDWALINPNERVCDYFHIFPLMHLDATDPKNYVFGPTDYLLKRTATGVSPVARWADWGNGRLARCALDGNLVYFRP